MFIALTMVVSTIPAMDLSKSDKNEISMINTTGLTNFETSPGSIVSSPTMLDELSFYDPATVNASALGLTGTAPFINWGTAIRLTPAELGPYNGGNITGARFFHRFTDVNLSGPYTAGHSGNLTIFDEGTATTPGAILAQEPWFSSASEWVNVTLTTPLSISGTSDMWIHFEINTWYDEHPMGLDGGPALQGKGDMAKLPSGTWLSLGGAGIDRNNCIGAFAEGGSGEINDVAMVDIIKPTSEEASIITPEVTIDNYGTTTPTDVPVNMQISTLGTPNVLLTEDFTTYVAPVDIFPPAGWSIIQTDPVQTWFKYSSGYARVQESGSVGAQDEWLITETFDMSGETTLEISFTYLYFATPDEDYLQILGSIDGGATWPHMVTNITAYTYGAQSFDISSWAAGQSQVKIAWRWVSGPASGTDYTYFYGLKICAPAVLLNGMSEDFDGTWGPYGDTPPTGWEIYDFGSESPPVWNANDWYNYYYSTFGSNTARVYYSPYESMDEWLITPSIDCSAMSDVTLSIRQYFYIYVTYPGYGIIEGSIDNGVTWTELVVNQTANAYTSPYYYDWDISSWAAGQSQVKIRFRYLAPGTQGRYWTIDDVMVGEISDEVIFFETYYFDQQTLQQWPTGWFVMDWDGTGVDFECYDLSTYAPPNSDGYFAYVKDVSGVDVSESLVSPSMDMTGMTNVRIQFDHLFDYWAPNDYVAVEIYSGGYYIEEIMVWQEDVNEHVDFFFDPSIYPFVDDIRIGFYYWDGASYAEEWSVDNIEITEVPVNVEYDETVYVDIESNGPTGTRLASQVVELPPWIPDDWQVTSNDYVEYQVTASVNLDGDVNPENDVIGPVTIALVYPFITDLGVTEIITPGEDMPAQPLPVEITVENEGQFPAEGFTATVEILAVESLGTCQYEVWLYDSYGDGWNGNVMDVYVDGVLVLNDITVPSGSGPVVETFTVGDGSSILMDWQQTGSWPAENYFDIYDSEATLIVNDWYPYTSGDWTGTASCPGGGPSGGILEYSETVTNTEEFDPDETLTVVFPDWIPAGIAAGESGIQNYSVTATVSYNPDLNAANDELNQTFTLDYFHDIEVQAITEPSVAGERADVFLGYNDGHTENAYAWVDGSPWTICIELSDPELAAYRNYDLTDVKFSAGCDDYGFYAVTYDIYYATGALPDLATLTPIATGVSSGTGWDTVSVPAQPMPDTGSAFIIVTYSNYGAGFPAGFDFDNGDIRGQHMLDTLTTNSWITLSSLWGSPAVWGLDAGLTLGSGPGSGDIFLQPGNYPFAALTANIGTFPETGLNANAKLFAFNETGAPYLLYEENYTDFDLDVDEEETATFGSYTFVDHDIYELAINLPLSTDDFATNNFKSVFIGIDDTAPTSEHALDPSAPTGANGWYVSDVTATLTAEDGTEDWQSGVDFIEYRIDGGTWQTGDTFDINTNGMHTIEYRATDNVGNVETANSFTIDMDKDGPTIDLTWEAGSAKNEVIFTATCSDADSGMDYVEFYINDVLQFTDDAAPYTWTMVHGAGTKYTVKAIAYDLAGNTAFDEIGSGEGLNKHTPTPTIPTVQTTTPLIK